MRIKTEAPLLFAVPGWKEVRPDVERLVGHLEEAEDAVGGRAAWMPVAGDDAVLMENLEREIIIIILT